MDVFTADGVLVKPLMTIYTIDERDNILAHRVASTQGKFKILFEHPDTHEGCRYDGAYSSVAAAEAALKAKYLTVNLDADDARLIRLLLAAKIAETQATIRLLRCTSERDLTELERFMLPATLRSLTREELEEQLNPWYTLEMKYQELYGDFEIVA